MGAEAKLCRHSEGLIGSDHFEDDIHSCKTIHPTGDERKIVRTLPHLLSRNTRDLVGQQSGRAKLVSGNARKNVLIVRLGKQDGGDSRRVADFIGHDLRGSFEPTLQAC